MAKVNDLKKQIYSCRCERCKALVRLIEKRGAYLQFSPKRAGRLCELAVVAASDVGLGEADVVRKRREYASHLSITLTGPISNAEEPVHIRWGIVNSNHNPTARNRINLGEARASFVDGRYRLT